MTGLIPAQNIMSGLMRKTAHGLFMGKKLTFNTKIADVEGNLYNTVTIGSQVWMAENLRTTKYNNNNPIPNVPDNTDWINLTTPVTAGFSMTLNIKTLYGALYNWFTVQYRDIMPH